jgi:hypothetical protein
MKIGPFGPGGWELSVTVTTPSCVYMLSFAPLSWGLLFESGYSIVDYAILQIGCIKLVTQRPVWTNAES